MSTGVEITQLLNAANSGDAAAQDAAYQLVYDELKRCARRQSSLTPGSSLSPTALVSELYLKLSEKRVARIDNRRHFFALASRAMRQIMLIAPCEKPLNASPLTCISMLSSAAAPT